MSVLTKERLSSIRDARPADIKVLFAVRRDLTTSPGGDTVQVDGTASGLRRLGVEVTVSSDPEADLSAFDCVHLFHLERVHETYPHYLNAERQGKPYVLSPIYWPRDEASARAQAKGWGGMRWSAPDLANVVRLLAPGAAERRAIVLVLRKGWRRCREEILAGARVVLPNSRSEAEFLPAEFAESGRCRVVPNAIDPEVCRAVRARVSGGPRSGVLSVGHFDVRKNQMLLIRALAGSDVPVTFVGEGRFLQKPYYRWCRLRAGGNFRFLGRVSKEKVLELMCGARVHVCPSRFETPGLANLEAAAMGANLVVPDCPPIREYFGDEVCYFSNGDAEGLKAVVLKALGTSAAPGLAERVLEMYTWDAVAKETLAAYEDAMKGG
jgi:glycosyltransferase involved in cell wall biosynthesis